MRFHLESILFALLILSGPLAPAMAAPPAGTVPEITVYKSPTCGCCKKWISHLRENGFSVTAKDVADMRPIKQKYGVPPKLSSCHTAVVDGYVIEGHVPAADIRRLLDSRAPLWGLTVPGMPIGSPGMEQGPRREPYGVLSIDRKGEVDVYSLYHQ